MYLLFKDKNLDIRYKPLALPKDSRQTEIITNYLLKVKAHSAKFSIIEELTMNTVDSDNLEFLSTKTDNYKIYATTMVMPDEEDLSKVPRTQVDGDWAHQQLREFVQRWRKWHMEEDEIYLDEHEYMPECQNSLQNMNSKTNSCVTAPFTRP